MTDNEIIKALEWLVKCNENHIENCDGCPIKEKYPYCDETVPKDALDLINRQKAEIERLEKENYQFADIGKMYSEIKAETIKVYAKRMHKFIDDFRDKREMVMLPYTEAALLAMEKKIDNLVKEMTEEKNDE